MLKNENGPLSYTTCKTINFKWLSDFKAGNYKTARRKHRENAL